MKKIDFLEAIDIISSTHSNKLVINRVKPNVSVGDVLLNPTIHIVDCCAATIKKLTESGFTVSMSEGWLLVSKY